MVTLLTIQILSILATTLTNLVGILTFATDYWSVIAYDLVKVRPYAKWIVVEERLTGRIYSLNDTNETDSVERLDPSSINVVVGMESNVLLYTTHKGIFRQCNDLSDKLQERLNLAKCRVLKTVNNQYDDVRHGMNNPGREFIRLHNVAASCAILIVLLLCACTLIGITVGILNSVVLASMTIGIIYLVITMFCLFVVTIMHTILKSERKQSHCFALEILSDHLCSSRSIYWSHSFLLGCLLVFLCFFTSMLWLSLQEKQRKFAQH